MKSIFVNKNSQLRSGWKIAIVLTAFLISANMVSGVITIAYAMVKLLSAGSLDLKILEGITNDIAGNKALYFILMMIQELFLIAAVIIFWKAFDRRPLKDIGLTSIKQGYKDLVVGLIIGILAITFVFLVLLGLGDISIEKSVLEPHFSPSLLLGLFLFTLVAFAEELFSRGYCMTVFKQTNKTWVMVLVSSVIFSVLHSLNPGIKLVGYINIFLVGVFLAYMFLKSGRLWMPIGFHLTWNYFQGNVYGFQVSGSEQEGIYKVRLITENILNGGKFGPEGGLVTTIVLLLGFVAVWMLYKRKGISGEI